MFKDGYYIAPNAHIIGSDKTYECWEFRYREIRSLYMEGMVAITCYVTLPMKYHYLGIGYFSGMEPFLASIPTRGHVLYSCVFVPVSPLESDAIIADIQKAHPGLKLLEEREF